MNYMKNSILLLSLICALTFAQGQTLTNISLQLGYHGELLNPRPLNTVIDSFNFYNNLSTKMAHITNVSGFSGAVGIHPGRSHFRFEGMVHNAATFSIGPDDQGVDQRRDLMLNGMRFSLGFTSELIEMFNESHFCVGASFNMNYLKLSTSVVPADQYQADAPLEEVMTSWKPSFTIHAPFRFGIGTQVKISLEPYYQIYFGPTNFRGLNAALNPETYINTPLNVEEGDLDHLGLNLMVIVFLRSRR